MLRPEPLSEEELKVVIRNARISHTFYLAKPHIQDRLEERGFSLADLYCVCEIGKLSEQPVWKKGRWRYQLQGPTLEEDESMTVVLAVTNDKSEVMAITVIGKD